MRRGNFHHHGTTVQQRETYFFPSAVCFVTVCSGICIGNVAACVRARVQLITVLNNALWGDLMREIWDVASERTGQFFLLLSLPNARAGQKAQPFFSAITGGFESSAQPSALAPPREVHAFHSLHCMNGEYILLIPH